MTGRWLAAILIAVPLVWAIVRFGLRPGLGLDLTDEGLYLLEASPPTPTAAWATPYGWHTSPLFRLVGYDIASFRSWGAWLLLIAAALLCTAAVSLGDRSVVTDGWTRHAGARLSTWQTPAVAGTAGVLAGFLYYAGMIRTPSYNWVTVLGATVATFGALQLLQVGDCRQRGGGGKGRTGVQSHVWTATIAAGLLLSFPAKPTTSALFVLLFAPAAFRTLGPSRSLRSGLYIAAYAALMLSIAFAARAWPASSLEVYARAVGRPTMGASQSLTGAVREFVLLPVRALQSQPLVAALVVVPALRFVEGRAISVRRRWVVLGAALSVSAAWMLLVPVSLRWAHTQAWTGSFVMRERATIPVEIYFENVARLRVALPILLLFSVVILWPGIGAREKRRAAQLLLLTFAVVAIEPQGSVLFGGQGRPRFVNAEVTTSLLLVFGSLLVGFAEEGKQHRSGGLSGPGERSGEPGTVRLVALTLVAFAFATGFGSGHLPYRQASLAAALLVAASLVLVGGIRDRNARSYAFLSVLAPLALLSAVVWADNQVHPYRMAPMAEQSIPTPVGVGGAVLFLDEDRHQLLTALERTAAEAGWQPGDRLFGLAAPWSSTIPWHLGATVPDSIMPTLRANPERLAFNLTWWDLEGWEDAWILTTPEAAGPALHRTTMDQAGEVATAMGRSFPMDYTKVWTNVDPTDQFANYELWRPNP